MRTFFPTSKFCLIMKLHVWDLALSTIWKLSHINSLSHSSFLISLCNINACLYVHMFSGRARLARTIVYKMWLMASQLKSIYFQTHSWSKNLQPIADHFVSSYKDFLPKLIYPVRVGEHANSAFGIIFPYEYANCKLQ